MLSEKAMEYAMKIMDEDEAHPQGIAILPESLRVLGIGKVGDIDEVIESLMREEYERKKAEGDIDKQIEKLVRHIGWSEPELALYVNKKMKQFAEEDRKRQSINDKLP